MRPALCVLVAMLAAGCASKPLAPVMERSESTRKTMPESAAEYRVRHGDTLYAIAFRFGLDPREVARWNGIRAPYVIYPDQELRLTPPPATRPLPRTAASRPADSGPTAGRAETREAAAPAAAPAGRQASVQSAVAGPERWLWPVSGPILRGFSPSDPARNGLDIAGTEGQDVLAAAAGTVVYSGNGLIGYGELIIIKHDDRMLSAYAHNRVRLVAEGAKLRAGQKIAEVGRNDRNEQLLHFEIRENGRPVNPLNYLPRR